MNPVLQVPELKHRFSDLMPDAFGVPMLVFRLGYADTVDTETPRRPLADVVENAASQLHIHDDESQPANE